jgi:hypothetical protein
MVSGWEMALRGHQRGRVGHVSAERFRNLGHGSWWAPSSVARSETHCLRIALETESSESRAGRLPDFPSFFPLTGWFTAGQILKALRPAGRVLGSPGFSSSTELMFCLLPQLLCTWGTPLGLDICHPWVHKLGVSGASGNLPSPQASKFTGASSSFGYAKREITEVNAAWRWPLTSPTLNLHTEPAWTIGTIGVSLPHNTWSTPILEDQKESSPSLFHFLKNLSPYLFPFYVILELFLLYFKTTFVCNMYIYVSKYKNDEIIKNK